LGKSRRIEVAEDDPVFQEEFSELIAAVGPQEDMGLCQSAPERAAGHITKSSFTPVIPARGKGDSGLCSRRDEEVHVVSSSWYSPRYSSHSSQSASERGTPLTTKVVTRAMQ